MFILLDLWKILPDDLPCYIYMLWIFCIIFLLAIINLNKFSWKNFTRNSENETTSNDNSSSHYFLNSQKLKYYTQRNCHKKSTIILSFLSLRLGKTETYFEENYDFHHCFEYQKESKHYFSFLSLHRKRSIDWVIFSMLNQFSL